MKIEITAKGVLVVSAETPIESFALQKWTDDNFDKLSEMPLCIATGLE